MRVCDENMSRVLECYRYFRPYHINTQYEAFFAAPHNPRNPTIISDAIVLPRAHFARHCIILLFGPPVICLFRLARVKVTLSFYVRGHSSDFICILFYFARIVFFPPLAPDCFSHIESRISFQFIRRKS